ncbi:MAG: alanine--tRNA ligase [Eubacterium sp.]|nr:alanine--tRNA ligase [Eubacterium sp.]
MIAVQLQEKIELIKKVILSEEESFGKTIDAGLELLDEYIKNTEGTVFSGEDAFKLNDTYGFPLDLTKDILEEKGMSVDEEKFNELLDNQKKTARAARKDAGADAWKSSNVKIEAEATQFVGYTDFEAQAKVVAIIGAEGELVDMLGAGEKGTLVLDKTPFYALSGGQVGDTGCISSNEGAFAVDDTVKNADSIYLHSGEVKEGVISKGDSVEAKIDTLRRRAIMRNHTAAHLLQHELRAILGSHVEQAGQLVDESVVRFDFTHFNALSAEEIAEVEKRVNSVILSAIDVTMQEMPIEEAKKMGAMMLFGEKYGDVVRVVTAGDSIEFCGGTHVKNSGELGLFKIVSEASVASGVRRITGVTGTNAYDMFSESVNTIKTLAFKLKGAENELESKVEALVNENKDSAKKISALEAEITKLKSADMFSKPEIIGELEVFTARLDGTEPNALRSMGDELKEKNDNAVAVIASANGEKATILAICGKNAVKCGVKAGDVVREVAKIAGGSGGGRPDSAMAGAKDIAKLDEAISSASSIVKSILG